jgi:hypothetical protein
MVKAMTSSLFLQMAIGGAIRRRFRYTKHGCNQTRSAEANLLDDGIDDTLASVGTTIALRESPGSRNVRGAIRGKDVDDVFASMADAVVLNHGGDQTQSLLARGTLCFHSRKPRPKYNGRRR